MSNYLRLDPEILNRMTVDPLIRLQGLLQPHLFMNLRCHNHLMAMAEEDGVANAKTHLIANTLRNVLKVAMAHLRAPRPIPSPANHRRTRPLGLRSLTPAAVVSLEEVLEAAPTLFEGVIEMW